MWFNGTYLRDKFPLGQQVALYGKLEGSRSGSATGAVPGATRLKDDPADVRDSARREI